MKQKFKERFERLRPLEQMEVVVVRATADRGGRLNPSQLNTLRYALNLARLAVVPAPGGEVSVEGALEDFRQRVVETLEPLLLESPGVLEWPELLTVLPRLHELTARARATLLSRHVDHFSAEHLDQEVCHKALVTVAGGGGGSGYVHIGAFKLLDDMGMTPRLLVGTSMGAIISLFRAKARRFDFSETFRVAHGLNWRDIFLMPQMRSNYGVPASLRLYLRKGIAAFFHNESAGRVLRMRELGLPLRVVVGGVGSASLAHDMDYYEHLMDDVVRQAHPSLTTIRQKMRSVMDMLGDFVKRQAQVKQIVLGGDELTQDFDVVDAVGFSSAIPGLIHYDIWREDPHMHPLMKRLFEKHGVFRLVDGGLVNNVPSRVAWEAVQRGELGTRNAFILALDCFAPQLMRNLMMHPLQRLVRPQVTANAVYAGFTKSFQQVLSPLELVPDERKIASAVRNGYKELAHDRRFLREMMRPLEPVVAPA